MSTRVRIRGKWRDGRPYWMWELLTADEHVANTSEPFVTRQACENDAVKQGLPFAGFASRQERLKGWTPKTKEKPLWDLSSDRSGLWRWQQFNARRELIQASRCAFLTKEECVADACKNGYPQPNQSKDGSRVTS